MGFLKKITRPISRALDKIVPNEIKPALPFLAAAAPFLAPGIMGTSMLQRALVSGGLNLGSQLAQEGSDGDFSALSLAMASGIGALSAPGTPSTTGPAGPPGSELITTPGQPSAAQFFETKGASMQPGFAKSGLGALESSSNYLTGVGETLRTSPFSKEGLKAALVPVGQGMTDLGIAEARRAQKDYDREMADYEAGIDSENSNRAFAIRQSMEAYGFTEQEILDAIEAAGYRAGGRVGLEFGGIPAAVEDVEEKPKEFLVDKLKVTVQPGQSEEMGILNAMFNDVEGVMPDDRKMEFYRLYIPQLYERGEISKEQFEGMKEDILGEGKKDGGRIGFKDGTDENLVGIETLKLGDYDLEGFQKKGRGNTLMFGSDDLKILSQALDYGELSDLPARQKEKIKESILRARAGIINPTELNNEIGMLRLEPDAAAFLKAITPDETMEKIFFDKEGDARIGVQKARKLMEDVAFGGQKNPTLSSDMYNKLGDEYIQDQKKDIQRRIDFNKEYGEANFLNFKDGGRIGLKNGSDGSSTGSFGANRYASELVESADSLLNKGDILMTDAEKLIASGKYPSEEELNEIQKRYDALVNKEETETNKFSKNLEDEKLGDALPYFLEKEKQINKRVEDSNTRADKIGLESLDVSDITRSPSFREWYSLWEKGDPKADKHPQAEYFEDLIFNVDRKKYIKTKYPDIKMADGGLMNLGGKEMDMRTGGFIPIGKKERADDVPARLSKNEFVMTADAVRAAGGGSVNKGAKRMYDLMNNLEARV